ncbi:MAG: DUF3792 family protein [Oscillibacter sp.]|nr:DUF3792 family protein [Oscillibacter sp.]
MAKSRKQAAPWQGFLMGGAACLGLYLAGLLLAALLMTKGTVSEASRFPLAAVLCVLAALCGGLLAIKQSALRAGGIVTGVSFAAVLVIVGLACWKDGIAWAGHGGILLLCALGGGILAGLLSGKGRGKRKRK